MSYRPIFGDAVPCDEVYADVILFACPHCHAEMGEFCHNPITHGIAKLPCLKRLKLADS